MSENTLNAGLRRLGYATDEMTGHGFRAMASTLLNESGKWSSDAIERALAHGERDKVRAPITAARIGRSASKWRNGGPTSSMSCEAMANPS
jgi:integrase